MRKTIKDTERNFKKLIKEGKTTDPEHPYLIEEEHSFLYKREKVFIKEKIDKEKYTKGFKQMATTLGIQIKDNLKLNVENMIWLMKQRFQVLNIYCIYPKMITSINNKLYILNNNNYTLKH